MACYRLIDRSKIWRFADFVRGHYRMGDISMAAVMEKEVLSKHGTALMLFGAVDSQQGGKMGFGLSEKDYSRDSVVPPHCSGSKSATD